MIFKKKKLTIETSKMLLLARAWGTGLQILARGWALGRHLPEPRNHLRTVRRCDARGLGLHCQPLLAWDKPAPLHHTAPHPGPNNQPHGSC